MNRYETASQVCERLSISIPTLYRWMEKGLPSIKIGVARRFDPEAVDAWVHQEAKRTERSKA